MTKEEIVSIFKKSGSFLEGHFLLSSGLHSPQYIEKFRVLEYPEYTEALCKEIAENFKNDKIELVVGPMTGGIILASFTAKYLNTRAMFTERVDNVMSFRRGFKFAPGTRILVVEDVITTGGSVKEVIKIIEELKGVVAGVGYLVDRSNGRANFGVKQVPMMKLEIVTYEANNCLLCQQGIELIKPGSKKVV
jgi:orotate phosphoribosyltransferase